MTTASESSVSNADDGLRILQQAARDFLTKEWPPARFRELADAGSTWAPELWDRVRGLGWPAVTIPEEYGGAGGTFAELGTLAQELGRAIAPTPLVPNLVAARAVVASGNEGAKQRVLPGVATGAQVLALALWEAGLTRDPAAVTGEARPEGDGYRLHGTKLFVPFAEAVTQFVAVMHEPGREGAVVALVPRGAPGVTIRALKTLDWAPFAEVTFDGAPVAAGDVLGRGAEGQALVAEALLWHHALTCAELLGVAETALEMAVEYAQMRVAFGRPIGAFQAVKHRLVNTRADIEVARALAHRTLEEMTAEGPEREVWVARTAFWSLDTLRRVPESAIQVFGGIGFTWDHDIHFYLRRAATLTALLGERAYHREVVADHLDRAVG